MTRAPHFHRILITGMLTFTCCMVDAGWAQNGNSPLSRYGIGEPHLPLTARNRGMGGASAGLPSTQDISQSNPALWTELNGLRLQGELLYENESFARDDKLSYGSAGIKALQFAFPVEDTWRTRFVAGFVPLSRVDYQFRTSGNAGSEPYTAVYDGSGGVSTFRAGAAVRPLPWLHVGAVYQYRFGSIDHRTEVTFTNGAYFPSTQTRSTSHGGSALQLGAALTPIEDLTAGFSATLGSRLAATRNTVVEYSTHDSTVLGASGTIELPMQLAAGLSYRVHRALLLAADVLLQDWTSAVLFDGKQNELSSSYRWGVGVEWLPAGEDSRLKDATNVTALRLGLAQQVSHVSLDGTRLTDLLLTAGAGFPIIGQNRADLAVEYGWRGGDDDPLGSRSIFRLSLTISVGESWFVRRGED